MLTSNVQLGYLLTRGGGREQADQGSLSCPPPPSHTPRISERMDNLQTLLHHLLQEYFVERDINITYWQGMGSKLSTAVYLAPSPPPARILERMDNTQILLHHVLQEYLVEMGLNFISVNQRCLLQTFSWVMYWQGVEGKLSRAVYLAPRPKVQRDRIISNFYYIMYFRNNWFVLPHAQKSRETG